VSKCRSSAGVDHRLTCRAVAIAKAGGCCNSVKKAKLPNEPNLKTAPPAIPASREGQPNEIYNMLTFNILQINTKPLAASEISLKRQKNPI
jgi:hypothetical protein